MRIVVSDDGTLPPLPQGAQKRSQAGIYCYNCESFFARMPELASIKNLLFAKETRSRSDRPLPMAPVLIPVSLLLDATYSWRSCHGRVIILKDAILISKDDQDDDIYTSIHIEEFEVTARDTKLGPEEITRDIPNAGEEARKPRSFRSRTHRCGSEARGHIVGKITPKSETDLAPEEKLLRAIFGEKAADVKRQFTESPIRNQELSWT